MIITLILFVSVIENRSWSSDSHRVIARIASQFLRESGRYFIAEHLTGRDKNMVEKSLIEHSTYADSVDWSDDLHFSYTPYRACSPFDMQRDCQMVGGSHRCIVTAIANYTMRASDVELKEEERAEAIKFLIHLVGDIHNPVHVGFAEDMGGNLIHLSDPAGKSLHNVWDYVLVNKKQVEHGVFKEHEEDEVEPWKFSDALLREFPDKISLYPYMLNLKVDDVATDESATKLAAGMASRTARDFTCKVAYQDEKWIESGDALSEEYLSSRSEAAMEMLKLAGIRLAEMINVIARQYNVNKHWMASKQATGPNLEQFSNPYEVLVLDFDFDADAYLYDESGDDSMKDSSNGETLPASSTPEPGPKKISKSKKARMRKALAKRMFEGVDLESVVLIKRLGLYIVTGSQLVTPEYIPVRVEPYKVGFPEQAEIMIFQLDVAHFGGGTYSKELIERCLRKIRNLDFPADIAKEEEESSISFQIVNLPIAPVPAERVVCWDESVPVAEKLSKTAIKKAKQLRKQENKAWMDVLGHVPSAEELSEFQINKNFNNICFAKFGRIMFFAHRDSLENKATPMMRASMFSIMSAEDARLGVERTIMLVDVSIYDGQLTENHIELLTAAVTANRDSCHSSLAKRPSLSGELQDIHTFIFNQDVNRVDTFLVTKFLVIVPPREGVNSHKHLHWSVHSERPQTGRIL